MTFINQEACEKGGIQRDLISEAESLIMRISTARFNAIPSAAMQCP